MRARPQQIVQPRRRRFDAPFIREPFGRPAHDEHGAQRDDEGHDAQARDEQPVREPADRARGDAAERRRPWPAVALQQQRDDDGAERDHRAHGQIDAARDDHHRHPERRHADDRRLARHQLEVRRREELRADERTEDRRHQHQSDERASPIDERARRHGADEGASAPVAAIISSCSVTRVASRAAPSVPRHITATRSQRPTSSGR